MTAGSSSIANLTVRSNPCGPVISTRTPPRNGSLVIQAAAPPLAAPLRAVRTLPEDSTAQISEKRRRLAAARGEAARENWRIAADLYMAAFLLPKRESPREFDAAMVPTTDHVWRKLSGSQVYGPLLGVTAEIREQARLFHWPLEFPDIFAEGGFDVVIGNPPWERVKLQEQEFFAAREAEIAQAPTQHARGKMIDRLQMAEPGSRERRLFDEFEAAKRIAEAASVFTRESGRFPLSGRGDVNTYALFAELFEQLGSARGRAGVIVPTGIATDVTTAPFFAQLIDKGRLVQLVDFENRSGLFPAVDSRMKFSLVTLGHGVKQTDFAFFLTNTRQLDEAERRFRLSADDIARINPNTRSAPVFRAKADASLAADIYNRIPVLVATELGPDGDPWQFRYMTKMFDMADSSEFFVKSGQLASDGFRREGTRWVHANMKAEYLPLYEAKMVSFYDHRASSYAERGDDRGYRVLPETSDAEHEDFSYEPEPFYWIETKRFETRLDGRPWNKPWLMGWKDVAAVTNERTVTPVIIPRMPVGHTIRIMFVNGGKVNPTVVVANLSSIVLDYVARLKFGGLHLTVETLKQLPVLPPSLYSEDDLRFIYPRVLELTYTSHLMTPFAHDLGYAGPPFKWNETRRAQLRAELDAWYARLRSHARRAPIRSRSGRREGHGLPVRDFPRAQEQRDAEIWRVPHAAPGARCLGLPGSRGSKMTVETPPSFIVRTELQKASFDNGFRIEVGADSGWLNYRSATAPGEIWLAGAGPHGPWFLSLSLCAVAQELGPAVTADRSPAPGTATFAFATLEELHRALDRTYRLSVSLPDAPLQQFLSETSRAPRSTEAERLVIQRVGQDIFRQALIRYWNGRCPLTGIADPSLLRASHIVPWAECETDAHRLDVHNGLLLSALWDAAFDGGLVSFDDNGRPLCAPALTRRGAELLMVQTVSPLLLTDAHRANLAQHRTKHAFFLGN
jgi:HNH endonuclease